MKLIQFVLVPSIFLLIFIYMRRFRSLLLDRMIILLIGLTVSVLVMKPEWSVKIAHLFGVGRGTDLMLYLGFLGLSFFNLLIWSKTQDLESRMTELVRQQALDHHQSPSKDTAGQ